MTPWPGASKDKYATYEDTYILTPPTGPGSQKPRDLVSAASVCFLPLPPSRRVTQLCRLQHLKKKNKDKNCDIAAVHCGTVPGLLTRKVLYLTHTRKCTDCAYMLYFDWGGWRQPFGEQESMPRRRNRKNEKRGTKKGIKPPSELGLQPPERGEG